MAIEVKKTKGSASRDGVKLLIFGGSGTGKTTLLASMGRTIIISSEKGDLALNDAENCESIQISSLLQLREAYNYVVANKDSYDTVGIDSISEIGQMVVAELKKDPEFSSMKDGMKLNTNWLPQQKCCEKNNCYMLETPYSVDYQRVTMSTIGQSAGMMLSA